MKRVTNLLLLALLLVFVGCATHKVVEPTIQDTTDTIAQHEQHDSVIVRERLVKVEVPVPVVKIERVVPKDTASTLTDGIYTSKALVNDGLLFHSLFTAPDAKVSGKVQVADTTKVSNKRKVITITKRITKTIYKEKPLSWFDSLRLWIGTLAIIVICVSALMYLLKLKFGKK